MCAINRIFLSFGVVACLLTSLPESVAQEGGSLTDVVTPEVLGYYQTNGTFPPCYLDDASIGKLNSLQKALESDINACKKEAASLESFIKLIKEEGILSPDERADFEDRYSKVFKCFAARTQLHALLKKEINRRLTSVVKDPKTSDREKLLEALEALKKALANNQIAINVAKSELRAMGAEVKQLKSTPKEE